MKIELKQNNKVFVFEGPNKLELHPIWLRERVSEKEHLDKNTEQRLFDPSLLKDIRINKVNITDKLLDIEFSDGVKIGVLTGSLLSTLLGYIMLLLSSKKK